MSDFRQLSFTVSSAPGGGAVLRASYWDLGRSAYPERIHEMRLDAPVPWNHGDLLWVLTQALDRLAREP